MSGFFGVLQDSDSDDDSSSQSTDEHLRKTTPQVAASATLSASGISPTVNLPRPTSKTNLHIPSYEDLSVSRADEITVLEAVYGEEFRCVEGVWGCRRLEVDVSPPDVPAAQIGCKIWYVDRPFFYILPRILDAAQ